VANLTLIAVASPAHASRVPLVLLVLGAAVAWVVRLWLWPNGPCGKCGGTGKNAGSTGRRWGRCRRCKGSGTRQRFGSKLVRRAVSRKKP
jgi:tRNA(Ile2) C34 agmatinyltransferase TiaS